MGTKAAKLVARTEALEKINDEVAIPLASSPCPAS
jgi:hypothetical protein